MVSPISEEFQTPEEISSRWRSVLCWRNIFNYSSWWFSASGRSRLKAASTGRANSSPCPFYSGIRNSLLKRSSRRRDISFHKSESVLMAARKSFARSDIGQKRSFAINTKFRTYSFSTFWMTILVTSQRNN